MLRLMLPLTYNFFIVVGDVWQRKIYELVSFPVKSRDLYPRRVAFYIFHAVAMSRSPRPEVVLGCTESVLRPGE